MSNETPSSVDNASAEDVRNEKDRDRLANDDFNASDSSDAKRTTQQELADRFKFDHQYNTNLTLLQRAKDNQTRLETEIAALKKDGSDKNKKRIFEKNTALNVQKDDMQRLRKEMHTLYPQTLQYERDRLDADLTHHGIDSRSESVRGAVSDSAPSRMREHIDVIDDTAKEEAKKTKESVVVDGDVAVSEISSDASESADAEGNKSEEGVKKEGGVDADASAETGAPESQENSGDSVGEDLANKGGADESPEKKVDDVVDTGTPEVKPSPSPESGIDSPAKLVEQYVDLEKKIAHHTSRVENSRAKIKENDENTTDSIERAANKANLITPLKQQEEELAKMRDTHKNVARKYMDLGGDIDYLRNEAQKGLASSEGDAVVPPSLEGDVESVDSLSALVDSYVASQRKIAHLTSRIENDQLRIKENQDDTAINPTERAKSNAKLQEDLTAKERELKDQQLEHQKIERRYLELGGDVDHLLEESQKVLDQKTAIENDQELNDASDAEQVAERERMAQQDEDSPERSEIEERLRIARENFARADLAFLESKNVMRKIYGSFQESNAKSQVVKEREDALQALKDATKDSVNARIALFSHDGTLDQSVIEIITREIHLEQMSHIDEAKLQLQFEKSSATSGFTRMASKVVSGYRDIRKKFGWKGLIIGGAGVAGASVALGAVPVVGAAIASSVFTGVRALGGAAVYAGVQERFLAKRDARSEQGVKDALEKNAIDWESSQVSPEERMASIQAFLGQEINRTDELYAKRFEGQIASRVKGVASGAGVFVIGEVLSYVPWGEYFSYAQEKLGFGPATESVTGSTGGSDLDVNTASFGETSSDSLPSPEPHSGDPEIHGLETDSQAFGEPLDVRNAESVTGSTGSGLDTNVAAFGEVPVDLGSSEGVHLGDLGDLSSGPETGDWMTDPHYEISHLPIESGDTVSGLVQEEMAKQLGISKDQLDWRPVLDVINASITESGDMRTESGVLIKDLVNSLPPGKEPYEIFNFVRPDELNITLGFNSDIDVSGGNYEDAFKMSAVGEHRYHDFEAVRAERTAEALREAAREAVLQENVIQPEVAPEPFMDPDPEVVTEGEKFNTASIEWIESLSTNELNQHILSITPLERVDIVDLERSIMQEVFNTTDSAKLHLASNLSYNELQINAEDVARVVSNPTEAVADLSRIREALEEHLPQEMIDSQFNQYDVGKALYRLLAIEYFVGQNPDVHAGTLPSYPKSFAELVERS